MFVGEPCKSFNIKYLTSGIGNCFSEKAFCVRAECCFNLLVAPVLIYKCTVYALFF